ncbi:hypothetical protein SporoP8_10890 [Sporosarcina ureae]|nr:hypothetical protein SporoP8_10890 [Sporosarcina ureae]
MGRYPQTTSINRKELSNKTFKIAVIAGDGIRPEVIDEGIKVMKKVAELDSRLSFEFTYFPWGCEYYLQHGKMMASDGADHSLCVRNGFKSWKDID